ncbi:MAG: hypothetical protein IPI67_36660 [Myxococcales bacterium]|nr:hypothetical protein [Myxococcales bacterium]
MPSAWPDPWKSWNDRFVEMKQTLVKQHGPPTVEKQTVSAECQSERFVQCMDDGSASVEATWQWNEGHRVSLTMSRKKSGDGPSAIRYTSVVNAGP